MSDIIIGTILKPQGVKGEVKVKVYTNDLTRFLRYKKFSINGVEKKVISSRVDHQYGYVKLDGIENMDMAETLRNKDLIIKEVDFPKLPKGEYYIAELMGCELKFVDGEPFAKVTEVLTQTRNIVIMAKGESNSYMFPLLNDVLVDVDVEKKIITVDEKRFSEVSVIED